MKSYLDHLNARHHGRHRFERSHAGGPVRVFTAAGQRIGDEFQTLDAAECAVATNPTPSPAAVPVPVDGSSTTAQGAADTCLTSTARF
jgi:hypothetical protein